MAPYVAFDGADPALDECPHGKTAGERCDQCDADDPPETSAPIAFLPVNPKALTEMPGLLHRCPICWCLVIDLDRCSHLETQHPGHRSAA